MKRAIRLIVAFVLLASLAACGVNNVSNINSKDNANTDKSDIKDNLVSPNNSSDDTKPNTTSLVSKAHENKSSVPKGTKEDNSSVTSKDVNSKNNSSKQKDNSSKTGNQENSSNTSSHEHIWGKWIHDEFPNPETGENGTSHRTCKICRKTETKELTPEEVYHMFTTDGLLYSQW